jgi:hypothetical protein
MNKAQLLKAWWCAQLLLNRLKSANETYCHVLRLYLQFRRPLGKYIICKTAL